MSSRKAFTIVELLVVIAVIAVLVSVLLPAVQAAREASRKTFCANNQKQVTLAVLNHVAAHGHLPAIRDPKIINNSENWASWRLTILPYLEEHALYDALAANPSSWSLIEAERDGPPLKPASVSVYQCPSTPGYPVFLPDIQVVAKPSGDVIFDALATEENLAPHRVSYFDVQGELLHSGPGAWLARKSGGFDLLGARLQWITDGMSHTILVAEEAGAPRRYAGGTTPDKVISEKSDSWFFFSINETGFSMHVSHAAPRVINWQNRAGIFAFHRRGAHVAFCDGAVRFLDEETDPPMLAAWLIRDDNGAILGRQ